VTDLDQCESYLDSQFPPRMNPRFELLHSYFAKTKGCSQASDVR